MQSQITWIGNSSRREFIRIARSLETHSRVTYFPTLEDIPRACPPPAVVCYAWARPGEFEVADLEPIERQFPRSKHVHILGELCCGMKRTSQKLARTDAVYAHELTGDLTVDRLLQPGNPDDEFTVQAMSGSTLLAIYSRSKSFREAIADSLSMLQLKSIQLHPEQVIPTQGVDYVLWDVTDGWQEFPDFSRLRQCHPNATILALVASPREYEIAHLEKNGIQVLAQPYRLRDLCSIFGSTAKIRASSTAA